MLIACEIYCGKNKRTGLLFLSWIRYNRPRDPLPSRGRLSTHGKGVIIHHGSIAVIKKQKHLCTGAKASVGKHCIAGIQYLLWRNVDIDVEGPLPTSPMFTTCCIPPCPPPSLPASSSSCAILLSICLSFSSVKIIFLQFTHVTSVK